MTISLSTELDAPPEAVWALLQRPSTLVHVSAPLLTFSPTRPFPETWYDETYEVQMRLGGLVPLGRQEIRVSRRVEGEPG